MKPNFYVLLQKKTLVLTCFSPPVWLLSSIKFPLTFVFIFLLLQTDTLNIYLLQSQINWLDVFIYMQFIISFCPAKLFYTVSSGNPLKHKKS